MEQKFWKNKRILVTGGAGFLGKSLVPKLESKDAEMFVPRSKDFDMRKKEDVALLFDDVCPEIVIHLAFHGGGIGYMNRHPGSIFFDNLMMNTLLVEYSRIHNVDKFVGIGTVCSYPKYTPVPFKETDLWNGYPEENNAPYGLAKKMMLAQTQAYRQEYGFNGIHILLVNMYGPYDDFSLESSSVIPALINKFIGAIENNKNEVIVWGTGNVSREFLYVEDAAVAIILATEKYNNSEPVNVGTGVEISTRALVDLIAELTGFKGNVIWDTSKPDGQPRRCLDITRAEKEFGFRAMTGFREGLENTIEWYRNNRTHPINDCI